MNNRVPFIIEYTEGSCTAGGVKGAVGFAAADVLRADKDTVSRLSRLYGEVESEDKRREAAELLSSIAWLGEAARSADARLMRSMIDEMICFRVYMRYFLTKCRQEGESGAQSLSLFEAKLPELESALRKENMIARTVMPKELSPKIRFAASEGAICEICEFSSLGELLIFDFMRALSLGTAPRICPSCGRYFLPERSNRLYCGGVADDGRLCREVGAGRAHSERVRNDSLGKICAAACGRINTRKCRGKLTAQEADALKKQCRELLSAAQQTGVSCETFEQQLRAIV